jgi:hypothetical protein
VSDDSAIKALVDRAKLDDLVTAYANSLDDRDWVRLRDLFAPEATLDFTGAYGIAAPRDEIVEWLAGQVTREFAPDIQHLVTNRAIVIDGDTAAGRVDYFNPDIISEGSDGRFLLMNGGRYTFEARREGADWLFTRFVGTVVWSHRAELLTFSLEDT